jgi:signal transduction histidine kinase
MAVIGALVAFGLGGGITSDASWSARLKLLAVCLIYGHCIAFFAVFLAPRWLRRFSRRNRAGWWLVRIAVLPLLIFVGGSAAWTISRALGLLRGISIVEFAVPYANGAPAIGMVAAIFAAVTGYEYLRDRIDEAALALRTKERDEANARRAAAEAQLASLESRVQPHFLFNTLNSIAALIPQDPAGAEKMTGQLASLLRSSLDAASAALVPLGDEIKTIRDYLDIEQVRFGPRLRYAIRVDDDANGVKVPRLSLQTLVENSVKYAVAPRREGGSVMVSASANGSRVRLAVSDDGDGFSAGDLPATHGLALLRDRLKLLFDGAATLTIDSGRSGTTVTIDLPRRAGEEGPAA